eukprot:gnl/TRDRNA2_/TRDRNA2_172253_c0_seq3.p1 gnl/TRDRNA2_/TRDRNA2_172253_c0~~gnl/TRDRNA2_/TRDRNA2_172253_c0_seq3.p1  ORF type:complete len:436 (-),score=50.91 gnl/TRDRNA2_/TRDRNA2_172253_c0_seq3:78-1208(-)
MAVIGGMFSTLGIALVVYDLQFRPPLHMEVYLIYAGSYLSDLGSSMVRFAIIGFTWHFPRRRGILMGMQNAASSWAVCFALVMLHFFMRGTPLVVMFTYFGIMNFCAIFLMAFGAPSKREYLQYFQLVSGIDTNAAADFKGNLFFRMWSLFFRMPYTACNISSYFSWACQLCAITCVIGYLGPFASELFQDPTYGADVSNTFAHLMILNGAILGPAYGILSDKAGIKLFSIMIVTSLLVFICTFFVADKTWFIASICAFTVYVSMEGNFIFQYPSFYFPADMVGSYHGINALQSGIIQTVVLTYVQFKCTEWYTGIAVYSIPCALFIFFMLVGKLNLALNMIAAGVPDLPPSEDVAAKRTKGNWAQNREDEVEALD